ncbi:MAG: YdeI/OmpD-associated family protein [Candidatus Acidiferrales bacterium]
MPTKPNLLQFQARIYKIWMMRHVNVPEGIGRALAKECAGKPAKTRRGALPKHLPVVATIGGCSNRTTLVPAGAGNYRLQIVTKQRKAADADTGDLIGVTIKLDRESREIPVPAELREALADHPRARKAFTELPPGGRRQFLLFLQRAKSPQVRARATARLIEILLERALLGRPKPAAKRKK